MSTEERRVLVAYDLSSLPPITRVIFSGTITWPPGMIIDFETLDGSGAIATSDFEAQAEALGSAGCGGICVPFYATFDSANAPWVPPLLQSMPSYLELRLGCRPGSGVADFAPANLIAIE